MKLFTFLFGLKKKNHSPFNRLEGKTIAEYQQEALARTARQQFEKLKDLGLNIPVRLA